MKTLLAAAVLSLASGNVLADAFTPWDDRMVSRETVTTSNQNVAPIGFAPWRDTPRIVAMPDDMPRISAYAGSIFRPWS